MASGTGIKAPVGFILFVYFVHILDILLRYGTFTSIQANTGLWALFAFLYFLIGFVAARTPAFNFNPKTVIILTVISYFVGPAVSMLATMLPEFGTLKALLIVILYISPAWIWATIPNYPRLNTIWVIFWIALVTGLFFSDIRAYAYEQAGYTKDSLPPFASVSYVWEKFLTGAKNFFVVVSSVPKQVATEIERSLAMAKGDYYTGQVDAAAQKRLGVYLGQLHPTEPSFYESTPVSVFTTLNAETLDKPLDISLSCDATAQTVPVSVAGTTVDAPAIPYVLEPAAIPATAIRPQSVLNVLTSDSFDVDCIWSKGTLKPAPYTIDLRATFGFTTRAYKKVYFMSRDRLREYRAQNIDPLANVPDRTTPAIYTSGPLRVGMGTQQQQPGAVIQPVAIGERGDALSAWGITLENAWEGKVLEITDVFIFIPEGIKIIDPEGQKAWLKTECTALPEEEHVGCDDALVDVYRLSSEELALSWYKNLTTKNIRVHVEVADPDKALGRAPIAVQNFKASVQYTYGLGRSLPVIVRPVAST